MLRGEPLHIVSQSPWETPDFQGFLSVLASTFSRAGQTYPSRQRSRTATRRPPAEGARAAPPRRPPQRAAGRLLGLRCRPDGDGSAGGLVEPPPTGHPTSDADLRLIAFTSDVDSGCSQPAGDTEDRPSWHREPWRREPRRPSRISLRRSETPGADVYPGTNGSRPRRALIEGRAVALACRHGLLGSGGRAVRSEALCLHCRLLPFLVAPRGGGRWLPWTSGL